MLRPPYFYDNNQAKTLAEEFLNNHFDIKMCGLFPQNPQALKTVLKYGDTFALPNKIRLNSSGKNEDEYTARCVIRINSSIPGAYVFSSGKNMERLKRWFSGGSRRVYMLDEYKAYL